MSNLVKDGKYIGPLKVSDSLYLEWCTGLTELPKDLKVGGNIYRQL